MTTNNVCTLEDEPVALLDELESLPCEDGRPAVVESPVKKKDISVSVILRRKTRDKRALLSGLTIGVPLL